MSEFINDKVIPPVMGFINTKPMQALKDGLLYSMPLMIVGSVFLLLQQFPIAAVGEFLTSVGLYDIFTTTYANTFNIMSLIAAMGIAYTYAKNEGFEGMPAAVISLSVWLMSQPQSVMFNEEAVGGVVDRTWLAGQGMVGALVFGVIVGIIYCWFLKKDITIKMPAGVPQGVANAFTALIPAAAIIVGWTAIIYIVDITMHTTVMQWVYATIQAPLQGLTDNLGGVIAHQFLVTFLWWFGIHGATIVGGVMGGILTANVSDNQAILDSGRELTVANGGHIFTSQLIDQFCTVTGSGLTLGLVVYLCFFAKSEQLRSIGKLGIAPGLFNINEPILFGTPIVLNPMLAVPFILTPVLSGALTYLLIQWGILPMFTGVVVPWTTPPIISGLLVNGWKTMVWQAIVIVGSFFIYFPFIKMYDNQLYKEEQEAAE